MIDLYVLLILMIAGAVVAIEVKDLLSSVIAVGAVGLGFTLVCLILQAPDVAITQLVVEVIAVVLLIRATIRKDLPASPSGSRVLAAVVAAVFGLAFLLAAAQVFTELPPFGEPTMRVAQVYLDQAVKDTGATNAVAAVLLDYRAYDTLGEATVLFAAAIGVLTIVRRRGRKEAQEPRHV